MKREKLGLRMGKFMLVMCDWLNMVEITDVRKKRKEGAKNTQVIGSGGLDMVAEGSLLCN